MLAFDFLAGLAFLRCCFNYTGQNAGKFPKIVAAPPEKSSRNSRLADLLSMM